MRQILLSFIILLTCNYSFAQRTNNPSVTSQNFRDYNVSFVEITDNATFVCVAFKGFGDGIFTAIRELTISSSTTLTSNDGYFNYTFPIRGIWDGTQYLHLDQMYTLPSGKKTYYITLIFDKLPAGCRSLNVCDSKHKRNNWYGISINNPANYVPNKNLSETEIKGMIEDSRDPICGIYEGMDSQGYKLACIKEYDKYSLVFLNVKNNDLRWKFGDVKAELRPSASSGLFKATWYMADKSKDNDVYIVFDGSSMEVHFGNETTNYLKMFPSSSNKFSSSVKKATGTGFAVNSGCIVTNYHVVKDAKKLEVFGINGNHSTGYSAKVLATDKVNDLAIIQIDDKSFNGFGEIPYKVNAETIDVGDNVFILGYPMPGVMGQEIKLTNGIISSRSGFQGDVNKYQTSAPIQPGNSGGPMFDSKGNVVGIVVSKIDNEYAQNVGYAIKTLCLKMLVENTFGDSILPEKNTIQSKTLPEKVKQLKNYVFMIETTY